jgi:outer membrane murein-binding lipoprotein Lpp
MARVKVTNSPKSSNKLRPAITPEADESQMISLAMKLVKQRLIDGTASSQETTHFLKLATQKAQLENKLLEAQTEMAVAKKEALQSQKRMDDLYADAIKAMRTYSGHGDENEEYESY